MTYTIKIEKDSNGFKHFGNYNSLNEALIDFKNGAHNIEKDNDTYNLYLFNERNNMYPIVTYDSKFAMWSEIMIEDANDINIEKLTKQIINEMDKW